MLINIDNKENLFEKDNLTPIYGKPIFEMLHYIRNEIKENTMYRRRSTWPPRTSAH